MIPTSVTPNHVQNTMIAKGVIVEGDFKSDGDVTIEGEVKGTLKVGGKLTIGQEAIVKATVEAKEAVLGGQVEGPVTINGDLELLATAKVKGDVQCQVLAVQRGAKLEGRVQMTGKAS